MKRLGAHCFTINSSELRFGWTFDQQVRKNPATKEEAPDLRRKYAAQGMTHRANQWVSRARRKDSKTTKSKCLEHAVYCLRRAAKIEKQ